MVVAMRTNLVSELVLVEGVIGQCRRIPFHKLDVGGLREDPDSGLLVADAAVAFGRLLDLGKGDLVDECRTVAVATVGLERCFLLGHFEERCGMCEDRSWLKREGWES